jgi:hypothetical protein
MFVKAVESLIILIPFISNFRIIGERSLHICPILRQQWIEARDMRGGQDHQDVEGRSDGDARDSPCQLQAAKRHPEILMMATNVDYKIEIEFNCLDSTTSWPKS